MHQKTCFGDNLQRLNYNKTVFGWGSVPDPILEELTTLSHTPYIFAPHYLPHLISGLKAPRSSSELVPYFLDQSYAPGNMGMRKPNMELGFVP